LIALIIMYAAAILASKVEFLQIDLVRYMGGEDGTGLFGLSTVGTAFFIWIMILMVYVYIASTLRVWKLLQPRDFINSHPLVVGIILLYVVLLLTNQNITAPVTNSGTDAQWFTLLFITIACGAIYGFHVPVS